MKKEQNIRYLLSFDEWALLLASAGIKKIYSFPFRKDDYSRNQVIGILEGMVKSEMAVSDGSIFHLQPGIKVITECVRECRGVICLEDGDRIKSPVCLYLDEAEGLAAAVPADKRKDSLRIWYMNKKELSVWMEEAGYLPESYLLPESLSEANWQEENQRILWQMTRRNADSGEAEKLLFLQQGGLCFRLLRQGMFVEEELWEFYGENQLQRAFTWLMED